jgi:hypothetical protein
MDCLNYLSIWAEIIICNITGINKYWVFGYHDTWHFLSSGVIYCRFVLRFFYIHIWKLSCFNSIMPITAPTDVKTGSISAQTVLSVGISMKWLKWYGWYNYGFDTNHSQFAHALQKAIVMDVAETLLQTYAELCFTCV